MVAWLGPVPDWYALPDDCTGDPDEQATSPEGVAYGPSIACELVAPGIWWSEAENSIAAELHGALVVITGYNSQARSLLVAAAQSIRTLGAEELASQDRRWPR